MSEHVKDRRTEDAVRLILQTEARVPELAEMASELIAAFGGPKAFAREYFQQYSDPSTQRSPMAKAKMLEGVTRLIHQAGAKKPTNPLEGLTEEDLMQVVRAMFNQEPHAPQAPS